MPFADLGNEGGEVLSSFANASFFHGSIVLHVAPVRNLGVHCA